MRKSNICGRFFTLSQSWKCICSHPCWTQHNVACWGNAAFSSDGQYVWTSQDLSCGTIDLFPTKCHEVILTRHQSIKPKNMTIGVMRTFYYLSANRFMAIITFGLWLQVATASKDACAKVWQLNGLVAKRMSLKRVETTWKGERSPNIPWGCLSTALLHTKKGIYRVGRAFPTRESQNTEVFAECITVSRNSGRWSMIHSFFFGCYKLTLWWEFFGYRLFRKTLTIYRNR